MRYRRTISRAARCNDSKGVVGVPSSAPNPYLSTLPSSYDNGCPRSQPGPILTLSEGQLGILSAWRVRVDGSEQHALPQEQVSDQIRCSTTRRGRLDDQGCR
jgi:hypothetical protein